MREVEKKIHLLADSLSDAYGVEIVDVKLAGSSRKPVVRVFIDKKTGVTLDECEKFSRSLSAVLDVENPIQESYILEVSSPGLDKPLRSIKDFKRNLGRLCRIAAVNNFEKRSSFTGRIKDIENEQVILEMNNGTIMHVPLKNIIRAKLEIEFK